MKKKQPDGYDVYVRTYLFNSKKEKVGSTWTLRTNGHATTELEMAQALTHDLTRMKVAWQIRNQYGDVIESYWHKEEAPVIV